LPGTVDQRKVVPLTMAQLDALRSALPKQLTAMVDAGSRAGLRQSELFGLAVEDIDRAARLVHVVRQVKLLDSGLCFALPKRGKTRDVPLSAAAGRAFAAHILAHPPVMVTLPWHEPGTRRHGKPVTARLMFTTVTGRPLSRHRFNATVWKPALRAAGIPATRENGTHVLRHSFASALIAAGVDIRRVAACLGHDDPSFTLRIYGHLLSDAEDSVRRALDAADRVASNETSAVSSET
jgi:integrase